MFFDSIVRRSISAYPNAKYVFAHPFVKNPEAQIIKNHFDKDSSTAIQYQQKSVGQMFLYKEDEVFYHFGIEKEIMGLQRVPCEFDPIEKTICGGGSVLIYVSKASIYSKKIISEFQKYKKVQQSDGIQKLVAQAQLNSVDAAFCAEYHDLPNKDLQLYSMLSHNGIKTKAKNVDYDHIVFDTYDYIDKLLGFKLSDVFYAAFHKYFEATNDIRADKLAKYVKYGTDDNKKIWMLRYGLSFEDIEVLEKYVLKIDKEEMVLSRDVLNLPEDKIFSIQRFLPQE